MEEALVEGFIAILRLYEPEAQHRILKKIKDEIEPARTKSSDTEPAQREVQIDSELPFTWENTLSNAARKSLLERYPDLFTKAPRAYSAWTAEEDSHLRHLISIGLSIDSAAHALGRQVSAIRSRLSRLELN